VLLGQGSEFAFVVFGAARLANVLPDTWARTLTLAVALSMMATPLLLLLGDRFAAHARQKDAREADEIDERDAQVIIAGFGRFGQIAGRMLIANGYRAVVLDHDPQNIETLRQFGMKVFYGDATSVALLDSAGAARASLLVNAIDNVEDNLRLTDLAQKHFPNLQIVARARNVDHYFQLRRRGVAHAERESFESALLAGRHALRILGLDAYEARELSDLFRRENQAMLEDALPRHEDLGARVAAVKRARDQLAESIARDRKRLRKQRDIGWRGDADLDGESSGTRGNDGAGGSSGSSAGSGGSGDGSKSVGSSESPGSGGDRG
jgi:glutathione-regulated potassium-efflux system ancillary protein KefC